MREVNIESTVASTRFLVREAERSLVALARRDMGGSDDWIHSVSISNAMETAFAQLMMLAEAIGLPRLNRRIRESYEKAEGHRDGGLAAYATDPDGEPHLLAASPLRQHIKSIEAVYGLSSLQTISKDVVEVLRSTLYAITDRKCFATPPASEEEMHHRIEAVLRCVFPDLDHKPPIPKAVKNFEPDTGLPSIRTLVEYKFIQTKQDVKRVADEILADTRGYRSSDWASFIFVIYETQRLKSEREWNRLLSQCGTAVNTQAVVLFGEAIPARMGAERSSPKKPPSR